MLFPIRIRWRVLQPREVVTSAGVEMEALLRLRMVVVMADGAEMEVLL